MAADGHTESLMTHASELPLFHVVGFSGHRQLADPAAVGSAVSRALEELKHEATGEWIALSSVAEGGDQVFVEQARKLGLPWHAILPLPKAEFEKDFDAAGWPKVEALLAHAEHLRVITENGSREDAYLDCGMETVNGSDVLLAVWDGEAARGKGGTGDIVEYATSLGKPVIVIDPNTLEVRRSNFERLERGDESLINLNHLPVATTEWAQNPFKAPAYIFGFQQKCDYAASRGAPQFRRLIVLTVVLHVVATLIAAAALSFDLHWIAVPWMKLLCLVARSAWRCCCGTNTIPITTGSAVVSPQNFAAPPSPLGDLPRAATLFEDLDLPGVRGLTRALHILHSRSATAQPVPMEEFKRIYLEQRIDDQLRIIAARKHVPCHYLDG